MHISIQLAIILLLILLNGIFAMAEVAMIYSRKARLLHRARQGDRRARIALQLAASPDRFLSTVQIGITMVGIVTGLVGGATVSGAFAEYLARIPVIGPYAQPVAYVIVVAVLTYLSLIVGELVPKNLALRHAESIFILLAGPMRLLSRIAAPAVGLLTFSTNAVLRLLRIRPGQGPSVTEEELRHTITQASQAGVLVKGEKDLVERMLLLGDRLVTAFMRPRTEIVWLDLDEPAARQLEKVIETRVAAFPVCRGSLDEMVGIAYRDRLWEQYARDREIQPEQVMESPLFVPEGVAALRVLELMKNTGQRIAIILDEYGSVEGLVSLTDFVSVVFFGARAHESDDEPMAVRRDDGTWLISGLMPIEEFVAMFRLRAEGEDLDVDTVGGFVMNNLGRVPAIADHFERSGLRVEVMDMDGRRVDRVLVSRLPGAGAEADAGELGEDVEEPAEEPATEPESGPVAEPEPREEEREIH